MEIRVLSFNIHKGVGWINRKSLFDIQLQMQILRPDIILLQEICGNQFDILAKNIWPHFSYGKNAVYSKGHHGNAILSRFPILKSKNISLTTNKYESRGLLHSIVKYNEEYSIHIFSVHLGLFKKDRKKQIEKIIKYIFYSIPEDQLIILGGDFNDWSGSVTNPLLDKFKEAFLSYHGSYARTFPSWAPILKLDRIYMRGFEVNKAYRIVQRPWKILSDHVALEVYLNTK